MKKTIFIFTLFVVSAVNPALAQLRVFACEPEWKALADELGKERVDSYSATTAYQDPHRIEARPGLIAKVRRADLVICSGADLEAGWLPLLLRQSGNAKVIPGRPGYFEASQFVERLDVGGDADRSMGDVHTQGNPHVHLDPRRLLNLAHALSHRLIELDSEGKTAYQANHQVVVTRWQVAMDKWQQQAKPLQGIKVITHHKDWRYLFDWLGMHTVGTLEPKPGLPASASHLVKLKNLPAKMIIHSKYQNPRAAQRLAKMNALPVVELPYTVGGHERATDLFGLFDVTIELLLKANK